MPTLDTEPVGTWLDRQAKGCSGWTFWLRLLICQCPGIVVGLPFLLSCGANSARLVGIRLLRFSVIGVATAVVISVFLAVVGAVASR